MSEYSMAYLKSNLKKVFDQIDKSGQAAVITKQGTPCYVVLDMEKYDQLRSSGALLKMIAKTEDNIEGERQIR